ncbi:hypothetical protein F4806DRAFT_498407 [Annulohypoxylon nitens]|nr:hypothetical protein F4806DRAFT_498407 [Annulohypoxylon nitens]
MAFFFSSSPSTSLNQLHLHTSIFNYKYFLQLYYNLTIIFNIVDSIFIMGRGSYDTTGVKKPQPKPNPKPKQQADGEEFLETLVDSVRSGYDTSGTKPKPKPKPKPQAGAEAGDESGEENWTRSGYDTSGNTKPKPKPN